MTKNRSRTRPFLAVSLSVCVFGIAGWAGAEDRGFYVAFEAGLVEASTLEAAISGADHPTRCDVLLYADPAMAPTGDPACSGPGSSPEVTNRFDLGSRFTGSLGIGYDLGRLRVEVEHTARQHDGGTIHFLSTTGDPTFDNKMTEWSPVDPPTVTVSDFDSRELFVNAYWDFDNSTSWTPFVGLGVGQARVSLRYGARLLRKTLAQGYQDVDPPLTLADRPAAGAGTISLFDSEFSDTLSGYQVLAGLDHTLGDNASFTIKARWARFEEFGGSDLWKVVRSHEPVQADGTTPFTSDLGFDGNGYVGVSVGLRYRF
ncbi:MAG: outer membrane beta-barrel protein [Acidobacteria bacterium]|nr:outer membrane beta-barrel protein [Acidobacteriota bacterium]